MGGTRENTDRYIGQTVYKSVCVGTRENKQVGRSDSISWIKKKILAATLRSLVSTLLALALAAAFCQEYL